MIQVYPDANRPPRLSSMVLLEEVVDYRISRFTVCAEVGIERNTKLPLCRNGEEFDPCPRFFTTVAPYTTAEFGKLPFHLFLIFVGNIQEEKRCIEAIFTEFCVEPLQDACPPWERSWRVAHGTLFLSASRRSRFRVRLRSSGRPSARRRRS